MSNTIHDIESGNLTATSNTSSNTKSKNVFTIIGNGIKDFVMFFVNTGSLPIRETPRNLKKIEKQQQKILLQQVGDGTEPPPATTLSSDDDDDDDDTFEIPEIVGEESDKWIVSSQFALIGIIACVGLFSGFVSIAAETSHIVDLAGFTIIILGPISLYQKSQLSKLSTLREEQNESRQMASEFSNENKKFEKNLKELKQITKDYKEIESKLNNVATEYKTDIDHLVSIVKENGELQDKIKQIQQERIIHVIMEHLLSCDRDGNFSIGKTEIKRLQYKLRTVDGTKFNEENFRKVIDKKIKQNNNKTSQQQLNVDDDYELTLTEIMCIIRNLLDDSVPDEENIFLTNV